MRWMAVVSLMISFWCMQSTKTSMHSLTSSTRTKGTRTKGTRRSSLVFLPWWGRRLTNKWRSLFWPSSTNSRNFTTSSAILYRRVSCHCCEHGQLEIWWVWSKWQWLTGLQCRELSYIFYHPFFSLDCPQALTWRVWQWSNAEKVEAAAVSGASLGKRARSSTSCRRELWSTARSLSSETFVTQYGRPSWTPSAATAAQSSSWERRERGSQLSSTVCSRRWQRRLHEESMPSPRSHPAFAPWLKACSSTFGTRRGCLIVTAPGSNMSSRWRKGSASFILFFLSLKWVTPPASSTTTSLSWRWSTRSSATASSTTWLLSSPRPTCFLIAAKQTSVTARWKKALTSTTLIATCLKAWRRSGSAVFMRESVSQLRCRCYRPARSTSRRRTRYRSDDITRTGMASCGKPVWWNRATRRRWRSSSSPGGKGASRKVARQASRRTCQKPRWASLPERNQSMQAQLLQAQSPGAASPQPQPGQAVHPHHAPLRHWPLQAAARPPQPLVWPMPQQAAQHQWFSLRARLEPFQASRTDQRKQENRHLL